MRRRKRKRQASWNKRKFVFLHISQGNHSDLGKRRFLGPEMWRLLFISYWLLKFSWIEMIIFHNTGVHLVYFCVLKKWGHYRIGQCIRPSVHTITLQRLILLWWNFVHRTVLLISRSSSKMRMIGEDLPELYQGWGCGGEWTWFIWLMYTIIFLLTNHLDIFS